MKELAEQTGISRHALENYLNVRGYISTTTDAAVKIARVLGVSVEYSYNRRGKPQDTPVSGKDFRTLLQNFKELSVFGQKIPVVIAQLFKKIEKEQINE